MQVYHGSQIVHCGLLTATFGTMGEDKGETTNGERAMAEAKLVEIAVETVRAKVTAKARVFEGDGDIESNGSPK